MKKTGVGAWVKEDTEKNRSEAVLSGAQHFGAERRQKFDVFGNKLCWFSLENNQRRSGTVLSCSIFHQLSNETNHDFLALTVFEIEFFQDFDRKRLSCSHCQHIRHCSSETVGRTASPP